MEFCLKAKKFIIMCNRCGIILQIFCENLVKKALSKIGCYVLLLARQNLKLKKLLYSRENWLSATKITRPKKLQHYFPIIINIFLYDGHKNRQKTKNIKFSLAYIRDLNLPPIRFVQFVPRFVARCRLYSFIISMDTTVKNNTPIVETQMANVETKMVHMKTDIEGKLETVNNEVRGLKTALVKAFDQMKDVLGKMDSKKENARNERNAPSRYMENIIVVGGYWHHPRSVEMCNWRQRAWSQLQSMPKKRCGATSFLYNNQVVIAGGWCDGNGYVDNTIRMNVDPPPDLSTRWSDCPIKLPAKMAYHSSVLYDDKLMVTGGYDGDATSDKIHEVQVVPPYTGKTLSRMPEPRQHHGTEIFDDSLLILGGTTTCAYRNSLSSVVLYDIKNNVCKQLKPLPYEVSDMATAKWGDNVVVIGGIGKRGNGLSTVVMYNVKTEESDMLPLMRYSRYGCTAVVVGNNIVVLRGRNGRGLKSVESFNFELNTWQEQ